MGCFGGTLFILGRGAWGKSWAHVEAFRVKSLGFWVTQQQKHTRYGACRSQRQGCLCTIWWWHCGQLIVLLLLLLLDRCFRLQCGEPDEVHRQLREPTVPAAAEPESASLAP